MGEAIDRYEALPGGALLHAAMDPCHGAERRIALFRAGYRGGKTHAGAWEAIRQSRISPGHNILCVAPTYPQAREAGYASVCAQLSAMGVRYVSHWSNVHEVRIPAWNGRLLWASVERPESLKGISAAAAWLDEPGIMPAVVHDTGEPTINCVISRVSDPVCQRVWLTGTPEGMNWLHEWLTGTGSRFKAPPPGLVADIRRSVEDNFHIGAGYVESARSSYSDAEWAAYGRGEFVDLRRGQVYGAFSRELHVSDAVAFDPALETCVTFDFNRAPMTALICQVAGGQDLRVVAEIILHAATTADACREVDRWLGAHAKEGALREGLGIYGDPAGHSQSVRSHTTDYQTILSELARWRPTKHAVTAHSPQTRRVDCVCWRLREKRVQIHSSCRTLTTDLLRVSYLPGSATLDKRDPTLTHASDALGYLIERRWPIGGGGGFIRG